MNEHQDNNPKEKKSRATGWRMIPVVVERVLGTIEGFADTLLSKVNASADSIIDRWVQKLFGLLALGAGMIFFLAGGAKMIDTALGAPGAGSMIIGVVMLLLTAIIILMRRT